MTARMTTHPTTAREGQPMSTERITTRVSEMSINFDDYTPEARRKYEGTHMFVGVHVPIEMAPHLTLSTDVVVEIEVTR